MCAVEWANDYIAFFVDGVEFHRVRSSEWWSGSAPGEVLFVLHKPASRPWLGLLLYWQYRAIVPGVHTEPDIKRISPARSWGEGGDTIHLAWAPHLLIAACILLQAAPPPLSTVRSTSSSTLQLAGAGQATTLMQETT